MCTVYVYCTNVLPVASDPRKIVMLSSFMILMLIEILISMNMYNFCKYMYMYSVKFKATYTVHVGVYSVVDFINSH